MEQKRATARYRQRKHRARLPAEEMQNNGNHNRHRMILAMEQKRAAARETQGMRRARLPVEEMQSNRNHIRDMMREMRNITNEHERDAYISVMRNRVQERKKQNE